MYAKDFNRWIEITLEQAKRKEFEQMDWDNLIDEIEDMGASQKRALDSYMKRLIEHLLKLSFWHEERDRCKNGWRGEVNAFRDSVNKIISKNPSLKNYLIQEYSDNFKSAKRRVGESFYIPEDYYIDLDRVLDLDFYGD